VRTIVHSGATVRLGALLLLTGPLVAWTAELVTAAAWQHPHYSPLYNRVGPLGLTGARQFTFGQVGYSPLGAVMDTGWVLYGTNVARLTTKPILSYASHTHRYTG
jgi:hypothetical protein